MPGKDDRRVVIGGRVTPAIIETVSKLHKLTPREQRALREKYAKQVPGWAELRSE
jgi:hypothetical protein